RHDRGGRGGPRDVDQVGLGEEGRLRVGEVDPERDRDHQDAGLPPAQELRPGPRQETAGRAARRGRLDPFRYLDRVAHECAIAPERWTTCCSVLEPSKRVLVCRYGSTLSLVTTSRPGLVWEGNTGPPDGL